jgi:hypothetical protein
MRLRAHLVSAAEARRPDDLDFAWKAHAAVQDWTRNVDQKASITLAIIVAVGGFAANQVFGSAGNLHALHGDQLWATRIMGMAFFAAGLSALHAVFPSLKRRDVHESPVGGLIYFGHLRHLGTDGIETALRSLTASEARRQLANQLHVTSDIAWKKHARLQRAHVLLVVALGAFGVAELW